MKALYLIFIGAVLTAGCGKGNEENNGSVVTVTGFLTVQGFTTYQYGSHVITNDKEVYALTSKTIQLNNYRNKTVTIKGHFVAGYPLEAGPQLIEVTVVNE